jgi:tripartite-type tricarboxylate transporter receptor subunit TctC
MNTWNGRRGVLALAGGMLAAPGLLRAQAGLSARMGQQFVVENRPGAAGTVAAQAVTRAPADGYTLLYDATAHSVNPSLFGSRLPYDTRRDLLPVFLSMVTPNTLHANKDFPAKSVPELIAMAKANPGKLDCSSNGIGTVQHVSLELFKHLAGVEINHVVYREAGASKSDLLSGRVPLQFSNVPTSVPILVANEARVMAHCGLGTLAVLPGVPAMADTLPGFETYEWNGIFTPAGAPAEIIRRLNTELNATIRNPAVAERLTTLGALTRANTPEEFAAFREQQITFFTEMVRMANIRID